MGATGVGVEGGADVAIISGGGARDVTRPRYRSVNGGVSTWESLQMGVPVVAKLGDSLAGRTSSGILSALGMSDWVAHSIDEYRAIALKFAAMPDELKKLRRELPAKIMASEAGNNSRYTRAVEAAYEAIWDAYCRRPA